MQPVIEAPRAPRAPFLTGADRPGASPVPTQRSFVRALRVFVSSPGDVSAERQVVEDAANELNRIPQIATRIALKVLRWENDVPPVIGEAPQAVVDRYVGLAASADVVVMLIGGRLGTPLTDPKTGLRWPSGTEYELDCAYQAYRRHGTPRLLVYRKDDAAATPEDPEEAERVRAFVKLFEGPNRRYQGIDPKRFSSAAVLKDHLGRDLSIVIHAIDAGRRKRRLAWLAGSVVLGVALGWATHAWYQQRQTQAAVDDTLRAALRSEAGAIDLEAAWAPVPARLVALGPRALRPMFDWLGRPEIYEAAPKVLRPDQTPTRALVSALAQQGSKGELDDVCARLFQILRSGDAALRYPKSTHWIAIEDGIAPLKCPGMAKELCAYISSVAPDSFVPPADVVADLRSLAARALPAEEAARCLRGGTSP